VADHYVVTAAAGGAGGAARGEQGSAQPTQVGELAVDLGDVGVARFYGRSSGRR
jgi:hypothetical protein